MGRVSRKEITQALDILERSILSLNYEGYFTRNLFRELKPVLDLWVGFRVHLNTQDGHEKKIHCYGQLEEDVADLKKEFEGEVDKISEDFLKRLNRGGSIWEPKIIPIEKKVTSDYGENYIETLIDIPLWVKRCFKCNAPFFLEYDSNRCANKNCTDSKFEPVLRGIIRFYSLAPSLPVSSKDVKRVSKIFSAQEDPDCFPRGSYEDGGFCGPCKFSHLCFKVPPPRRKDLLDPDEVVHQLHDKCRMIMGSAYQFPTLLYDAKKKVLRYRAVDYIDLQRKAEKSLTEIDWDKIERDLRDFKALVPDKEEYGRIHDAYEQVAKIVKRGSPLTDNGLKTAAQYLLQNVIQRTQTGITRYIWNAWESRNLIFDPDNPPPAKTQPDLAGEALRHFVEGLFFTAKYDGIIATPLGYLGQKLGVMFIIVDREKGENATKFKNRLNEDSVTFLRISREFGPLLFHSLIYEVYTKALNELEKKTINEVPNILLSLLPKVLNIVAGGFWSLRQIIEAQQRSGHPHAPKYLHAFEGSEEHYFLKEIKGGEIDATWKYEFNNPSFEDVIDAWHKNQAKVYVFCPNGSKVYKKDRINIRSRFLLPVRTEKLEGGAYSDEIQGVFDLYFDLSDYILTWHNQELLRELNFLFVQTANAANQKQNVLKHSTKAAVAAIMSRNMSHNVGSHVLSYWTNLTKREIERADKNIAKKEWSPRKEDYGEQKKIIEKSASLIDYLKQRMDFIAEMATTVPSWEKSLRLAEIIDDFKSQDALLDNIGRSEGFTYKRGCINEKGQCDREKCQRLLPNKNVQGQKEIEPDCMSIVFNEQPKGISASIPHGLIGRQALYSIFENFIRNSTKYGGQHLKNQIKGSNTKKALVFTIDISKDSNYKDYWKVVLSDNIGNCLIKDENGETVRDRLHRSLQENRFVDEEGKLVREDWGVKEMKISANFLRKATVDELSVIQKGKENSPPLVAFECYADCAKNMSNGACGQNLKLSIYLRKPKEVCIIVDKKEEHDSNSLENINEGIYCYAQNQLQEIFARNETVPHRFIIFRTADYEEIDKILSKFRDQLPYRIIVARENNPWKSCRWLEWHKPVCVPDKVIPFGSISSNPRGFVTKAYELYVRAKFNGSKQVLIRGRGGQEEKWQMKMPFKCYVKKDLINFSPKNWGDWIIFDNHGFYSHICLDSSFYYHDTSGGNSFGKLLENLYTKSEERKLFVCEVMESAMTKVVIIDERLWKNSQHDKVFDIAGGGSYTSNYAKLLEKRGIFLIPVDDYVISEGDQKRVLSEYDNVPFLIIHMGILDKIKGDFLEKARHKYPFVLIDSGRGEPPNMKQGMRYIPIGALENLIAEGDKYALAQTIFSVRRTIDNG
ncbi:MAG: hypothetical protein FJ115_00115 [Deltaproteobacteria bacterium]|nr:hypothetical protein [Deltaproteobacteria bacterium]MBM4321933.1 hypothetical protein [Deltaproteobacteria bacterium]